MIDAPQIASAAGDTIIRTLALDVGKRNERLNLALQKIEGIMTRAGIEISYPPTPGPEAANGIMPVPSDLGLLRTNISTFDAQVSLLEILADSLLQLA